MYGAPGAIVRRAVMSNSTRQSFTPTVAWPRLVATLVATLAGTAVVAGWRLATEPASSRWFVLGLGLVLFLFFFFFLARIRARGPSYVDGSTLVQRGLLRTHRADLALAVDVRLRSVAGAVQLVVRDRAGRRAFENLVLITLYVQVAQPPAVLDALSRALASAPDLAAAGVCRALEVQAEHLRAGDSAASSPLRVLTNPTLANTPEAARRRAQLDAGGSATRRGDP
jgi:hypothetical protein